MKLYAAVSVIFRRSGDRHKERLENFVRIFPVQRQDWLYLSHKVQTLETVDLQQRLLKGVDDLYQLLKFLVRAEQVHLYLFAGYP